MFFSFLPKDKIKHSDSTFHQPFSYTAMLVPEFITLLLLNKPHKKSAAKQDTGWGTEMLLPI